MPLLMPPGGFSLSPWAGKEETGFSVRRGLRQALGAPWGAGWPLRTQETSGGSCTGPGGGHHKGTLREAAPEEGRLKGDTPQRRGPLGGNGGGETHLRVFISQMGWE